MEQLQKGELSEKEMQSLLEELTRYVGATLVPSGAPPLQYAEGLI